MIFFILTRLLLVFFLSWKVAIVPIVAAQAGSSETGTQSTTSILDMLHDSWASYGLQLLVILSVLSLAPAIVMMVTSFTRFTVVFSLLRNSLGTQQAPPNMVLISLSLFLTSYVMAPTVEQAYREGIAPMIEKKISQDEAYPKMIKPFHQFMGRNVRQKDLKLFFDLTKEVIPKNLDDVGYKILIPAFMISELHKAFEIGFIIFIPFLIIDLVISSILMAMGMMMLPPVLVSLPFKIVFFILIDGWNLLCGSLVDGFN
jgi:flagellar biosynthetic protein FliP